MASRADIFGGCNSPSDFAFQTFDSATAAGQALLDQVFLDVTAGLFDSDPALTVGCSNYGGTLVDGSSELHCRSTIPYTFHENNLNSVEFIGVRNQSFDTQVCPTCGIGTDGLDTGGGSPSDDTSVNPDRNWAVFRLAPVPAPATLPLFATGLGVMGWFGWRKKRKSETEAFAI